MSSHRQKAAVCRLQLIWLMIINLARWAQRSLMDVETLTSATEIRLTVNEWLADVDAEETQAAGFNLAAYMDSPAVVKAPLSSMFGSAMLPLLDEDTIDTY